MSECSLNFRTKLFAFTRVLSFGFSLCSTERAYCWSKRTWVTSHCKDPRRPRSCFSSAAVRSESNCLRLVAGIGTVFRFVWYSSMLTRILPSSCCEIFLPQYWNSSQDKEPKPNSFPSRSKDFIASPFPPQSRSSTWEAMIPFKVPSEAQRNQTA